MSEINVKVEPFAGGHELHYVFINGLEMYIGRTTCYCIGKRRVAGGREKVCKSHKGWHILASHVEDQREGCRILAQHFVDEFNTE